MNLPRIEASVSDPVPVRGVMEFTDGGTVRLTVEFDLARELARAVITQQVPDFRIITNRAYANLMAEFARKMGKPDLVAQMLKDQVH